MTNLRPWLLLLSAAVCAGCGKEGAQASANETGHGPAGPKEPPTLVAVEPASRGTVIARYTTTATLEAENRAQVLARTEGVVQCLVHEEGDVVGADAELLHMEDDAARLRLQQGRGGVPGADLGLRAPAASREPRRCTSPSTGPWRTGTGSTSTSRRASSGSPSAAGRGVAADLRRHGQHLRVDPPGGGVADRDPLSGDPRVQPLSRSLPRPGSCTPPAATSTSPPRSACFS